MSALFRQTAAVAGGIGAVLQVTIRDASEIPLSGQSVHIAASANVLVSPAQGMTDANGILLATVTSTNPGMAEVIVTAGALVKDADFFFTKPCARSQLVLNQNFAIPTSGGAAAGDLNGDGFVDLVTALNGNALVTLLNDGNGIFRQGAQTPSWFSTILIADSVTDLNGDKKADVVAYIVDPNVTDPNAKRLALFAGTGDGTLQAPIYIDPPGYFNFILQDADNDGLPDIVRTSSANPNVEVFFNAGAGSFPPTSAVPLTSFTVPQQSALADINADGRLDIITGSNDDGGDMGMYLSTGYRQYSSVVPIPTHPTVDGNGISHLAVAALIAVGDVTGDGLADIVAPSWDLASFDVYRQEPGNTFAWAATFATPMNRMTYPVLADFNGDGHLDVVFGDNALILATNGGQGDFNNVVAVPVGSYWAAQPVVADFNGDGAPDVAVSSFNNFAVLLNSCL